MSFSMTREGYGFDKLPWSVMEGFFRTHFGKGEFEITVCAGEVDVPALENRAEIIHKCRDFTTVEHKGE